MCECACVFVGLEPYLGSLRPWMFMRWLSICRESSGCVFRDVRWVPDFPSDL